MMAPCTATRARSSRRSTGAGSTPPASRCFRDQTRCTTRWWRTTRPSCAPHEPWHQPVGGGRESAEWAKKWSGRRDSNPRPSPWQGDALPTEPLPLGVLRNAGVVGAESQSRTGDTAIFSRVLYQLSYLGPAVSIGPDGPVPTAAEG